MPNLPTLPPHEKHESLVNDIREHRLEITGPVLHDIHMKTFNQGAQVIDD
jgi:hypothetical protein